MFQNVYFSCIYFEKSVGRFVVYSRYSNIPISVPESLELSSSIQKAHYVFYDPDVR